MNLQHKNLKNIRLKPHTVLNLYQRNELKVHNLSVHKSTAKVLATIARHKQYSCQCCGISNMYFLVSYQFITPYFTKPNGYSVLVTAEHNLLPSLGGIDSTKNYSILCHECSYKRKDVSAELPEFIQNPNMEPNFCYIDYLSNSTDRLNYNTKTIPVVLKNAIIQAVHTQNFHSPKVHEALESYLNAISNNTKKVLGLNNFIRQHINSKAFNVLRKAHPELSHTEIHNVLKQCFSYDTSSAYENTSSVRTVLSKKFLSFKGNRYIALRTIAKYAKENSDKVLHESYTIIAKGALKTINKKKHPLQEQQFYVLQCTTRKTFIQHLMHLMQYLNPFKDR